MRHSIVILKPVTHVLVATTLMGGSLGAAPRESTRSLVAKYRLATCAPLTINPHISPRSTRSWNADLTLWNGSKVVVQAAAMPGGIVTVTHPSTGERFVAAAAGDYVYPDDIRIDRQTDRLYIIASGLAGGLWSRTVLFEYDLRSQRQTARRGVKDKDLPKACPGESWLALFYPAMCITPECQEGLCR